MSTLSHVETKPGHLALQGELSIFGAAELKTYLLARLAENSALELDLSGVSALDTSGVQLLLLLRNEALLAGKPVKWVEHSHAVRQVLQLLNLGGAFDAPADIVWS